MGNYLKINLKEAGILREWFMCLTSEGYEETRDHDLNMRIEGFILQEEEKEEDGERHPKGKQREQTD